MRWGYLRNTQFLENLKLLLLYSFPKTMKFLSRTFLDIYNSFLTELFLF